MKIDRQQFMDDGYLILRDVVAPEQLEALRDAVESMVDGCRERSRQKRLPNQPPGGRWAESGQPRLCFNTDCDRDSALAVDFLLGETTLGVCRQLIDAEQIAVHNMNTLCSGDTIDAGPGAWHRDIGPGNPAPLLGMIANMERHGPSYLQWNIALYEDSVLWIVPQSHKRKNTEAENRQLAENPKVPLPGGMPVELGAGDGVVYTHLLLHWGSNYTREMRRAIHPGYRPFNFASMPNVHWRHWEPGFFHHLSDGTRAQFEAWDALFLDDIELYAELFRTMIDQSPDAFAAVFARLHPSPDERTVSLVMLNNLSLRMDRVMLGEAAMGSVIFTERDSSYLCSFFTPEESALLRQRFARLDAALRLAEPVAQRGRQGAPSIYRADEMPAAFGFDDFVAGW